RQKSSSSMVISDITGLAAEIQSLLEGETEGVVVVQGTDTIEETAFALEMLLDSEKPGAVTGAMRNPDMRGADGPANLLAAIRTVSCSRCRELGVMVVYN
ncbi:asparaginase domain-containing protein, partial [[Clostridium] symbiosum]|uniref:asparaginase domain-containing protein n=1 Tax=Clostridium symbiosum TaxID=1512 RepID=UPI002109E1CD